MVVLDVRVDAHAARTEIEHVHLAQRFEIVHGLVHGLQRDRRHLGARLVVQRLDGRVRIVRLAADGRSPDVAA